MTLVELLRKRLADARAGSFQLMGEDLALLSGSDLRAAAAEWDAALAGVDAGLRAELERNCCVGSQ